MCEIEELSVDDLLMLFDWPMNSANIELLNGLLFNDIWTGAIRDKIQKMSINWAKTFIKCGS